MFQEAADRELAVAKKERRANRPTERDWQLLVGAAPPTDMDWQLFLEAARGLLDLDDHLKTMGDRRRLKLIRRSIDAASEREKFIADLRNAGKRVANSSLLDDVFRGDALAGFRVLIAYLVGKGLTAQDRRTLSEVTKALHQFWRDGESRRRKTDAAKRTKSVLSHQQAQIRRVQKEAKAWRRKNPKGNQRGSVTAFAKWLNTQNKKWKIGEWNEPGSVRSFIYRNRIKV